MLKEKKLATDDCIWELQTAIEIYSMETETKGDFNLQTKATKKELVKSLENALVNLEKELKLL